MGRTSREKSGREKSGPAASPRPVDAQTIASAAPKRTAGKAHPQAAVPTHQSSFILRYFSGAASDSEVRAGDTAAIRFGGYLRNACMRRSISSGETSSMCVAMYQELPHG